MTKRKSLITILIALALGIGIAIPVGFIWIITTAKLELGGGSPGKKVVGTVARIEQRAMEQYCTGVVATPQNTWLVGRRERAKNTDDQPGIDLDALIHGKAEQPKEDKPSGFMGYYGLSLGRDPTTTYLSRLDDKGEFVQVASLGETACLVATPDGGSIFLLTGMDRPGLDRLNGIQQTVILRSDDQGANWTVLEEGLFPEASRLGWALHPYFFDARQAWAWGSLPQKSSQYYGDPDDLRGGLFYSPDSGLTREAITASDDLLVSLNTIRSRAPADANWGDYNGAYGQITTHIQQFDDLHAAIWVSQSFLYGPSGGKYLTTPLFVTSQARLVRENGQWRMEPLEREFGLHVDELANNGEGLVIGVIRRDGEKSGQVAQLNPKTLAWKVQGALPSAFSPLPSSIYLREFRVGKGVLLANTDGNYTVPTWLYPARDGDAANLSANAVFYSTNWGRSWSRLAMGGYLGMLGLDPGTDRVFWANGNWYDTPQDLNIYSYQLD